MREKDLTKLLPTTTTELFLAGDFNSILDAIESTGHKNYSRVRANIVSGFSPQDVWDASQSRRDYTHYASRTPSRLDRIYVTNHLLSRKQGVVTVATDFTDHLAVVLRQTIDIPLPLTGRGYWRTNVFYLHEKAFRDVLQKQWARWHQHKRFYPNSVPPPPGDCIRQINTAVSWYIWRGDIFRVPISTL